VHCDYAGTAQWSIRTVSAHAELLMRSKQKIPTMTNGRNTQSTATNSRHTCGLANWMRHTPTNIAERGMLRLLSQECESCRRTWQSSYGESARFTLKQQANAAWNSERNGSEMQCNLLPPSSHMRQLTPLRVTPPLHNAHESWGGERRGACLQWNSSGSCRCENLKPTHQTLSISHPGNWHVHY